ncbi:MAG TPA: hypothetical protein DCY38_06705 [Opitutae bacterium]|jgi:hypothetical protein|nr:hypothetical protein [Opitutae bacterium]
MNVTIKIDDALCKEARHRAVDADLSLSGWVAKVLAKELSEADKRGQTLVEAIGMDDERDLMEFIPDRKMDLDRPIEFP